MWFRWLAVPACVFLLAGCSTAGEIRDVPASLVAVIGSNAPASDLSASSFCAGVLTAADIVTTAAHCVADHDPERIDVQVSADNLCSGAGIGGQRLHVTEVRVDPVLDLAELELEGPAEATPARAADGREASSLTAWGWGTGSIGGASPCEAAPKRLVVAEQSACEPADAARYGDYLCALPLDGGANTCAGDSGGPVLDRKGRLVAITVAGVGCGPDDAGIYLRWPTS